MSRTQLKLQLMREQLQEQERREAEQKSPHSRRPPPAPALKVPIQSIGIDVPPQVLQVSTTIYLNTFSKVNITNPLRSCHTYAQAHCV